MAHPLRADGTPSWQEDASCAECPLCQQRFNFFRRRHHCRRCGSVVCGTCSQNEVLYEPGYPLATAPDAVFAEPEFMPHRTCDPCLEEMLFIGVVRRNRFGELVRVDQHGDQGSSAGSTMMATPGPMEVPARVKDRTEQHTVAVPEGGQEGGEVDDDADSERDRCPVCGDLLKEMDEHAREEHINQCLTEAEFSGSPERPRPSNRMLVYYIPFPDKDQKVVVSCSDASNLSGNTPTQEEKVLPRFEECVICLEELSPGDKVGRLECLCVFHYKCIKGWFKRKGPGECPVHAVHM